MSHRIRPINIEGLKSFFKYKLKRTEQKLTKTGERPEIIVWILMIIGAYHMYDNKIYLSLTSFIIALAFSLYFEYQTGEDIGEGRKEIKRRATRETSR